MHDGKEIPDLRLEQLALGELSPARRAEVEAKLDAAGQRERLDALARSDAEILAAHPPARVAAAIRQRAEVADARRSAMPGWRWALVLPALLLFPVAASLLPSRTGTVSAGYTGGDDGIRLKGLAPHLVIHRQRGDGFGAEQLGADAQAATADALQLGYVAAGRRFGVVLSVDGRGAVTLHLPQAGTSAAPLASGGEILLPSSYQLDDAPGFERFFLVTSDRPFTVGPVVDAARALAHDPGRARDASLPLPASLSQSSTLLRKASSP